MTEFDTYQLLMATQADLIRARRERDEYMEICRRLNADLDDAQSQIQEFRTTTMAMEVELAEIQHLLTNTTFGWQT